MSSDTWTLATLNLNGLRSAVRKGYRSWFRGARSHVLCLQELRMQADQMTAEHQPPRTWHAVQADAEKKGYSGTAIWSRLEVQSTSIGCGLDWADGEGRLVQMDTDQAKIISVYVPSGSSGEVRQAQKDAFLEHFLELSAEWMSCGRPVVLAGDFNIAHREIDIHNPRGNAKNSGFLPHERAWVDRLLEQGWVDVFRTLNPDQQVYSWWSNRGRARELDRGWRLDYQFATPDLASRAEAAWIRRDAGLSDHAPVLARYRRM